MLNLASSYIDNTPYCIRQINEYMKEDINLYPKTIIKKVKDKFNSIKLDN